MQPRRLLPVYLCLSMVSCGGVLGDDYSESQRPPRWPDGSWLLASDPAEFGWNKSELQEAREYAEEIGSAAVVVVDDGRLIAAWGATHGRWYIASQRKSLLSALYGPYVDTGVVNLDTSLAELNIDDVSPALTPAQKQATIRNLLTSSSNICHDAAEGRLKVCPAPALPPGDAFAYNNFDFNVLGTIFRKLTGKDLFEDFAAKIAGPLGMEDFNVKRDTRYNFIPGSLHPAYVFDMSARDLARFGLLLLRGGVWSDAEQRILSQTWVAESTASRIQTDACFETACAGYGYMWWRPSPDLWKSFGLPRIQAFSAEGSYQQGVFVFPELNMVIVHRGHPIFSLVGGAPDGRDVLALIAKILRAKIGRLPPQ